MSIDAIYLSVIILSVVLFKEGVRHFAFFSLLAYTVIYFVKIILINSIPNYTTVLYIFLSLVNYGSLLFLSMVAIRGKVLISYLILLQILIYGLSVLEITLFNGNLLYKVIDSNLVNYPLSIGELLLGIICNVDSKLSRRISDFSKSLGRGSNNIFKLKISEGV